ncbi:hypothetical protein [Agromyces binzhouensis]|uniref:hypothetical protein n=1 Tax=Agromyces binzhouensis TaxID=1817495 RepID=UPI001A91239D|nr:hypothetical protein [Agromyces binzhouensis]
MSDAPGIDPPPSADDRRPTADGLTDAQRSLRAQMLATEHWSLLASRSTTQSELLTRIAIFLTLVSAGLVTLSVLGNVTGFRGWFGVAAISVLALLTLLGFITQTRVLNGMTEDLAYVIAMNRLRGAYLDLDPGLAPYLLSSANDDRLGAHRTYFPFGPRPSQPFASSMTVITSVESAMVGLLIGAVVTAFGGGTAVAVGVGVVIAVGWFVLWARIGYVRYREVFGTYTPLHPTPRD